MVTRVWLCLAVCLSGISGSLAFRLPDMLRGPAAGNKTTGEHDPSFLSSRSKLPFLVHLGFPAVSFPLRVRSCRLGPARGWLQRMGELPAPSRRLPCEHNLCPLLVCPCDKMSQPAQQHRISISFPGLEAGD